MGDGLAARHRDLFQTHHLPRVVPHDLKRQHDLLRFIAAGADGHGVLAVVPGLREGAEADRDDSLVGLLVLLLFLLAAVLTVLVVVLVVVLALVLVLFLVDDGWLWLGD